MINETIDRFMVLMRFSGTVLEAKAANGIYSANYKLAILIVIFIQTFRMGAEPFFFKNASSENAKKHLRQDHEPLCDCLLLLLSRRCALPGHLETFHERKKAP